MHRNQLNPRELSFSQAQGYECVPSQLKLDELPDEARVRLWNLFHTSMRFTPASVSMVRGHRSIYHVDTKSEWREILLDLHCNYFHHSIESESFKGRIYHQGFVTKEFEPIFRSGTINEVFDLLTEIMRNEKCPKEYISEVSKIFKSTRLAYFVLKDSPVTIVPQATEQEGESIIRAFNDVDSLGMSGAKTHLRRAGEAINHHQWPESIRHSISAVESVARQLDPNTSKNLGRALKTLRENHEIHPALAKAFLELYGYTSDEGGIRHALLEDATAKPSSEEAIFMLGACASFVTYLCSKHSRSTAPNNPHS